MLLRENFQQRTQSRTVQQFQSQLLTLLSQIIQRQDRGNLLLQRMVKETDGVRLANDQKVTQALNRFPLEINQTFRQPPKSQSLNSIQPTISRLQKDEPRKPMTIRGNKLDYDRTLEERIEASKKKLANNSNQLLSGLNRVLTNLDSEKLTIQSRSNYNIDISRMHGHSPLKKELLSDRSQIVHRHRPVPRQKNFQSQVQSKSQVDCMITPPKIDDNRDQIYLNTNHKISSSFKEQSQVPHRISEQINPLFGLSGILRKSKKQENVAVKNNGFKSPSFPKQYKNKFHEQPINRSPTINFTGDNITIENSRIEINIENDGSSIEMGKHTAKQHSKIKEEDVWNKVIDSNIVELKAQDSIINDERGTFGTIKTKMSLDGRFGVEKIQVTPEKESLKRSKSLKSSPRSAKKSVSPKSKKNIFQEYYLEIDEQEISQQKKSLKIIQSPPRPLFQKYSAPNSKDQKIPQLEKSDDEDDEQNQKEFGQVEMPRESGRINNVNYLNAKRKNTTESIQFRNPISLNDQNNMIELQTSIIAVSGHKNQKGLESSSNPRSSQELFPSTKILNIPWELIGRQLKLGKNYGQDPANGEVIESMGYKFNNNFDNMKMYSRLTEVQPYSDKREMKVRVSFYEMFTAAGITEIKGKKQFGTFISQWLGITYRATASIAWNMLQNHRLDFQEVKILFTENIIYNYIELMKDIRELGLSDFTYLVPQIVNKKTIEIITYLCKQFPQTRAQAPNMALRSEIPNIDEKGRIEYELVRNSGVSFKLKKSIDYSSEIMMFINYLIDVSNQHYDEFEQYMSRLFSKLLVPQNNRNQNQNIAGNTAYTEKAKKYTKFVIGRKIPKNAPKYTQQQIDNGIFFIKSSAVLRVIAKWVQDLIQIVKKPDVMIRDWFHPFKNHQGNQQYAEYPIRKGIYNAVINGRKDLYQRIENIKKECYKIEGELSARQHISDQEQVHLSEQQLNVGLFSSNLRNALSSYLCQQLNEVIHFLLGAPTNVSEKKIGVAEYFEDKSRNELDSLNLITFRIFDLLRCRCASGESEIIWLISEMQKLQKADNMGNQLNKFSIIRFKDRLGQGSRDVLINVQIGKGPVCEIQLSVSNQVQQKQDLLDKYNHFLYELRRATMLGPLIENVSIWTNLQQRSTYFDEIVNHKFKKSKVIPYVHKCAKIKMKKFMQPMICISCSVFFHIPRTCLMNWLCVTCRTTICGQCLYSGMNPEDRKKQIFGRFFGKQFLSMLKQFSPKGGKVPARAFFLKKEELKAELCYMTSYTVQQNLEQENITKAVQTIIKGDKIINRGLISNNEEIQKLQEYIIYEFDPHGRKQCLTLSEIQSLDMQNENKLRYINLLQEPNYLQTIKQIGNTKKKMRLLIDLQKVIENKKVEVVKVKKTLLLVQVSMNYHQLQAEIVRHQNFKRIRQFSEANSSVISIERKNMTNQIDMLRDEIGTELYYNLQRNITKVYLNYGHMESIESLSFLINLQSLSISDNSITSLKGIQKMNKLKIINFDRNQISSLEPIRSLVKLEYIMGNQNQLASMKEVQKLRKLKQISFHANKITRIEGLEKLAQLQVLFIKNNQIDTLERIQYPKRLEQLTLSGNNISDFKHLVCLMNLKQLSLSELKLVQIPDEVNELVSLHQLDLSNNQIEHIRGLNKLTNLKKLKLKNNLITQIKGLESLKLTYLNLDGNKITVLTGISNFFDTIQELDIRNNSIQDVGDLKDVQIQFKIQWTKAAFKPKARFDIETAFKQVNGPLTLMSNALKTTNIRSSNNLGESTDISLRFG